MSDTGRLTAALAGRYVIEREVGQGGMATVYLAEDVRHHSRVALKVLRPELAATLGVERFLREIEVAANLQHPHIPPLFDSGEAEGFLFYVMPYIYACRHSRGSALRRHPQGSASPGAARERSGVGGEAGTCGRAGATAGLCVQHLPPFPPHPPA